MCSPERITYRFVSAGTASGCVHGMVYSSDLFCNPALHAVLSACLLINLDKGYGSFPTVALHLFCHPQATFRTKSWSCVLEINTALGGRSEVALLGTSISVSRSFECI